MRIVLASSPWMALVLGRHWHRYPAYKHSIGQGVSISSRSHAVFKWMEVQQNSLLSCRGGIPNRKFGPFFVNHDDATLDVFPESENPFQRRASDERSMRFKQMHILHAASPLTIRNTTTTVYSILQYETLSTSCMCQYPLPACACRSPRACSR